MTDKALFIEEIIIKFPTVRDGVIKVIFNDD